MPLSNFESGINSLIAEGPDYKGTSQEFPRTTLEAVTGVDNTVHGEDACSVVVGTHGPNVAVFDGATQSENGSGARASVAAKNFYESAYPRIITQLEDPKLTDSQKTHLIMGFVDLMNNRVAETDGVSTLSMACSVGAGRYMFVTLGDSPIIIFNPRTHQHRLYTERDPQIKDPTIERWLHNFVEPPNTSGQRQALSRRRFIHSGLGNTYEGPLYDPSDIKINFVNLSADEVVLLATDGITDVLPLEPTQDSRRKNILSIIELLEKGVSPNDIVSYAKQFGAGHRLNPRGKNDDRTCVVIKPKDSVTPAGLGFKEVSPRSKGTSKFDGREASPSTESKLNDFVDRNSGVDLSSLHRRVKGHFGNDSPEYALFLERYMKRR